jgi:2-polyprenyl-3-methyl-5-hydroxy-6-metoxy-1,4-benzoquinol methylase
MKYYIKKILLKIFKLKFFQINYYKLTIFLQENLLKNTSNLYEFQLIKRINTNEGNFTASHLASYINSKVNLNNVSFLDIGCGDLFLYEELLKKNIKHYYGHDINQRNLDHGLQSLKKRNIDITKLNIECNEYFNFHNIKEKSVDIIFSQALCSHLNINSLFLLFRNINKINKDNTILFSSFIVNKNNEFVGSEDVEKISKGINNFNKSSHTVKSFFLKDPYHYNIKTISKICELFNWKLIEISDYDHPIQKMLIFKKI